MVVKYRNIRLATLETTSDDTTVKTSLSPEEYAKLLTFDNPGGLEDMNRQIFRLTAPPPAEPIAGRAELTVNSMPYLVAHGLEGATLEATAKPSQSGTDLVLIRGERSLRTTKVPKDVAALSPVKQYRFSLHWHADTVGYRVVKVHDGNRTVYESVD
jgi:hypothetical protein